MMIITDYLNLIIEYQNKIIEFEQHAAYLQSEGFIEKANMFKAKIQTYEAVIFDLKQLIK